jgi:hypothetical protein
MRSPRTVGGRETGHPEEGKRIDLTIKSLIRRGLIEGGTLVIEDAYQLTIAGLSFLENKSRSVKENTEESSTLAEAEEAPTPPASRDATGTLESLEVKKPRYIPSVGDIVWFLDQDGETDQVGHLIREVFPDQKHVEISPRWGDDFKKETIRAHWSRVTPRDDH